MIFGGGVFALVGLGVFILVGIKAYEQLWLAAVSAAGRIDEKREEQACQRQSRLEAREKELFERERMAR
jgi:hypothetical protein